MPPTSGGMSMQTPPAAGGGLADSMDKQNQTIQAHFKQIGEAKSRLGKVRKSLDQLLHKSDTVTQKDVIEASGAWVAAGLTPKAVAAELAGMPQDGAALAGWVTEKDDDVTAREKQLEEMHEAIRHQLGVSSVRALAAHHFDGSGGQPVAAGADPASGPQPSAAEDPGQSSPAANPLAMMGVAGNA